MTEEVMKQLVTSLVLSRLDYCDSVLFGLPASALAPLQRVQNVAARLVLRLDHRAHIKPALQRLHWLPVKARIEFNIATVIVMHGDEFDLTTVQGHPKSSILVSIESAY